MSSKVTHSTPLLHVAELPRTIRFYELLGFRTTASDEASPFGWARLRCQSGDVMFLKAEPPIEAAQQGFMFFLFSEDLKALRDELISRGVTVSDIKHHKYMPEGTINLTDPDGYKIEIAQLERELKVVSH